MALRFFSRLYIHGHTVGGTNPSLVDEALGAGSSILAHDNKFNRWVAGEGACYFSIRGRVLHANGFTVMLWDEDLVAAMRKHSLQQIWLNFTWDKIYQAFEDMLLNKLF